MKIITFVVFLGCLVGAALTDNSMWWALSALWGFNALVDRIEP